MSNELAKTEASELVVCEAVIERCLHAIRENFVQAGVYLARIRDDKLYEPSYETFQEYCRDRWELEWRRAYQLIDAASVFRNLNHGSNSLPENERQTRPLVRLNPEQQREAWAKAVEMAPNGMPKGGVVAAAVDALFPKHEPIDGQADLPFVASDDDDPDDEGSDEPEPVIVSKPPPYWSASELERKTLAEKGWSVLANKRTDHALIAWAEKEGRFIAIDRMAYPYGNPMRLDETHDRETVIAWYRDHWLPHFRDEIDWDVLANGKVLACWCHPEPCHGEVLLDVIRDIGGDVP